MDEKNNTAKNDEVIEGDVLKSYKNKDTRRNKEILKEKFYHGSKKTKHQILKKQKG